MKKNILIAFVLMGIGFFFHSCDDSKTYAEMKEEERDAINNFINEENIQVISEQAFKAQNETTDTAKNEFVLFDESGVYMQIIQKGRKANGEPGEKLEDGRHTLLARYLEVSIKSGDTLTANINARIPDEIICTKSEDSFSATFTSNSTMSYYGTSVPSGWLVPLNYLTPVRTYSADDIARVRLIVPHSQGQMDAVNYVYPCYYEITYQPF